MTVQTKERQCIKVGKNQVELPAGVTLADWALEKKRSQNPRIRSYLGCIRIIEEVLESNYAILNCSPVRLHKIWQKIRRVCLLIRSEIAPTLKESSHFPELDKALSNADGAFEQLSRNVLDHVERYSDHVTTNDMPKVRKLLCISVGKLYAFLRDTLGEILASDPRSHNDSDYFLSKRFAQEIEESEWLYSSVYELHVFVEGLEKLCSAEFQIILAGMRADRMITHSGDWERLSKLIEVLLKGLTPKLRAVLLHRSIRLNEIEVIDEYAFEIPYQCKALIEVYEAGREVIEEIKSSTGVTLKEREQSVDALMSCHLVFSRRMVTYLSGVNETLRDLEHFISNWLSAIERRRCMMLTKNPTEIRSSASFPEKTARSGNKRREKLRARTIGL